MHGIQRRICAVNARIILNAEKNARAGFGKQIIARGTRSPRIPKLGSLGQLFRCRDFNFFCVARAIICQAILVILWPQWNRVSPAATPNASFYCSIVLSFAFGLNAARTEC